MKASLHSARIAPKKAQVIARMVRGLPVTQAQDILARTHKKAARMIEALLQSAVANATHNAKQRPEELVIRTIVVNQGTSYRRGVPMARGRTRPMRKFLSHIDVVLGVMEGESEGERSQKKQKSQRKITGESSHDDQKMVKRGASKKTEKKHSSPHQSLRDDTGQAASSPSSASSASS